MLSIWGSDKGVMTVNETAYTALAVAAKVAPSQRVKYTITPETDKLITAESLGLQLAELSKLFSVLSEQDGFKCKTCISGIGMDESGTISFELVIAHMSGKPSESTT